MVEIKERILEYKEGAEANIVSIIYKNPKMLHEASSLNITDFSSELWGTYFGIAKTILAEGKEVLDDITIGLFLKKNDKLKIMYDRFGGYDTIEKAKEYIREENFDAYLKELAKWNVLLKGYERQVFSKDKFNSYKSMAVEDIYVEQETLLNDLFVSVEADVKSYNACEGLDELIKKLNEGHAVGLQYEDAPLLNDATSGSCLGNITMFGGLSGMGKSTMSFRYILPAVIREDEKIVVMINEEDENKVKQELLITMCNILGERKVTKKEIRNGNFTEELMFTLKEGAKYLQKLKDRRNITIIPFTKYRTSLAIKVIRKYSAMGVKYFVLDTFKADSDGKAENAWLQMQKASVDLYDTIKPTAKNVHLWITFQLGKQSSKQRYYSQDNIGMAKNIIDVASTCIMVRKMMDKEKPTHNNPDGLEVYKLEGQGTKTPIKLHEDKRYVILFIVKNRMGSTDDRQIVAECDLSTNTYKEIGYCHVPEDF